MYISPQKSFVIFIVGLSLHSSSELCRLFSSILLTLQVADTLTQPTIAVKNSTKKILRIKATKGRPLFVSVRYCIYRLDSIYGFIFLLRPYGFRSIVLPLCITAPVVLSVVVPSVVIALLPATGIV